MQVAVIGGGAAGFFAALSAARSHPDASITIHERSDKLLSKVRISGGGRCNVTYDCTAVKELARHYPRGEHFLRKAFTRFAVRDTIQWFADRGVRLKVEEDGRMFPITDDSDTIIGVLEREARKAGVRILLHSPVSNIECRPVGRAPSYVLGIGMERIVTDRVIVTIGGHPKGSAYSWLERLGHTIIPPVPSLFTFNIPDDPIRELKGVVVHARVRITGSDLESTGPVLITHWGFSGPAILRLSAWGARTLHALDHRFTVQLNWVGGKSEDLVRSVFHEQAQVLDRKQARNADPFHLPKRFWTHQLVKAGIPLEKEWGTIGKKDRNRLVDLLTNDRFKVIGKTTFREEFVTAGGVSLDEVDPLTMQSRKHPGLYFAGEVLDIDGITGGFNFQAAWTTGYIAGLME